MLTEFRAEPNIRGNRLDLTWTWRSPGPRPGLRLLRRQRAYPAGPADGLVILNLPDLFVAPNQLWARIRTTLYLVPNGMGEGGLRQAGVEQYFDDPAAAGPVQVVVSYYDTVAGSMEAARLEEVSRVELAAGPAAPWENVATLDIFASPGGGPEELAGQVVVSTGHSDGLTPDLFQWVAPGNPPVGLVFDHSEVSETVISSASTPADSFRATVHTTRDSALERVVTLGEALDMDTGDWQRTVTLSDRNLAPETVYYYALFVPDPGAPGIFVTEPTWRVAAMATGRYGLDERLYHMLPAIHRQYDQPLPGASSSGGPLRRYLQIFGAALDQVRSQAESLRGRHDVLAVRADLLPHLARWIGWEPDQTLDTLSQRNDILFAPEVYETVGTLTNLCALINRGTGWKCQVKEFVHNVFMTNAPESIHLWEIWERQHDGLDWTDPVGLTRTEGFDGRPATALDAANVVWLFWHANRNNRREIWLQRLDGVDPAPRRAMLNAPDDSPNLSYIDEEPAAVVAGPRLWLFWTSNRTGSWNVWGRPFDGLPGGAPVQLTDHRAEDRRPAAVRDGAGRIWLFWQSSRRGPTDIWVRVLDGPDWGPPARLTTARFRDEMPAAVVDGAGRIWLFYVVDQGDRRNIHQQIFDGAAWSDPEPVTDGLHRDEAPAAVFWNGQVNLFWHSNRTGHWQIYGQIHDGLNWSAPFTLTDRPTADKEPAAVVDAGGQLRLFWRSQRRGEWYRSRTIDTNDPDMLAQMGAFQDRAHYTYDTGRENRDWYARDAVGLYLTPDTDDPVKIQQQLDRVRTFIEPFRPVLARFVWLAVVPAEHEVINTDGLISDIFSDEIT